jgi:hypothetical protein
MVALPAFVSLLDTTTNKCWEVTREFDGKKKPWPLNGSSYYNDVRCIEHIT